MSSRLFSRSLAALLLAAGFALLAPRPADADKDAVPITFANHRFTPQAVTVTAGKPVALKVINASNETIEFESFKLNREIAMTPGETITVRLPTLRPDSYDFYDDFHQDVPEGSIIAK